MPAVRKVVAVVGLAVAAPFVVVGNILVFTGSERAGAMVDSVASVLVIIAGLVVVMAHPRK